MWLCATVEAKRSGQYLFGTSRRLQLSAVGAENLEIQCKSHRHWLQPQATVNALQWRVGGLLVQVAPCA